MLPAGFDFLALLACCVSLATAADGTTMPRGGVAVLFGGRDSTDPIACVTSPSTTQVHVAKTKLYPAASLNIAAQCCENNTAQTCRRHVSGTTQASREGCIVGYSDNSSRFVRATTYFEAVEECTSRGLQLCDKSCKDEGCAYNHNPVWSALTNCERLPPLSPPPPPLPPPSVPCDLTKVDVSSCPSSPLKDELEKLQKLQKKITGDIRYKTRLLEIVGKQDLATDAERVRAKAAIVAYRKKREATKLHKDGDHVHFDSKYFRSVNKKMGAQLDVLAAQQCSPPDNGAVDYCTYAPSTVCCSASSPDATMGLGQDARCFNRTGVRCVYDFDCDGKGKNRGCGAGGYRFCRLCGVSPFDGCGSDGEPSPPPPPPGSPPSPESPPSLPAPPVRPPALPW